MISVWGQLQVTGFSGCDQCTEPVGVVTGCGQWVMIYTFFLIMKNPYSSCLYFLAASSLYTSCSIFVNCFYSWFYLNFWRNLKGHKGENNILSMSNHPRQSPGPLQGGISEVSLQRSNWPEFLKSILNYTKLNVCKQYRLIANGKLCRFYLQMTSLSITKIQ